MPGSLSVRKKNTAKARAKGPSAVERQVEKLFGLKPELKRATFLPLAVDPKTNDWSVAVPQVLYDMAGDFVTPGLVAAGQPIGDPEAAASRFALNFTGTGGVASRAGRGALGEGRAVLGMSGAPKVAKNNFAVKALPAPPKQLALPAPGPGLPAFAVKPKGGQWFIDKPMSGINFSPENAARGILARQRSEDPDLAALYDWWNKALPRYMKNEMGTPEDPLRDLATRGLLHVDRTPDEWSKMTSQVIRSPNLQNLLFDEKSGWKDEIVAEMPWLTKVPATDSVYAISPGNYRDLEFGHVADELENALRAEQAGLPPELAVRPESLQRMSFPAAVERVGRINQFRVKQMEQAKLGAQDNPAISLFKEYADDNPMGLRWVELKAPEGTPPYQSPYGLSHDELAAALEEPVHPGESALREALKYEGDTMGHCVGGYCPDVMSGRSRIFSLRDAKGEPHVTIETAPPARSATPSGIGNEHLNRKSIEAYEAGLWENMPREGRVNPYVWLQANRPDVLEGMAQQLQQRPDDIIQIKGKQNRAPKDTYLPFVQDFVKSQKWGNIGDLANKIGRAHV